jgi:hypothetical protein
MTSTIPNAHKQQPVLLLGERNGLVSPGLPRHRIGRVCPHIRTLAFPGPILQDKFLRLPQLVGGVVS